MKYCLVLFILMANGLHAQIPAHLNESPALSPYQRLEEVKSTIEERFGHQIWATENLNTTRFRNGDLIPEAQSPADWERAMANHEPAWCYLQNDPVNGAKYGKLYNFYAVTDSRGLAPEGWRVPNSNDWINLLIELQAQNATADIKSTSGWMQNGSGATQFNALPGGFRYADGSYDVDPNTPVGAWWCGDLYEEASLCMHIDDASGARLDFKSSGCGFSVRCIKGEIPEVQIGTQTWMGDNLRTRHFRNGEPIPYAKTQQDWLKALQQKEPAYCHYNFEAGMELSHGLIYNWYAVNDPRGLAPEHWHVAAYDDWIFLQESLSTEKAGLRMKHTVNWGDYQGQSGNGTNESGFGGQPGGAIDENGNAQLLELQGYWWSASEVDETKVMGISLSSDTDMMNIVGIDKKFGCYVRCVKD